MKVSVYAAWVDDGWQWNYSIDLSTDLYHWFGLYGAKTSIVSLEPLLSLGQAQSMIHQLRLEQPRHSRTPLYSQQERTSSHYTQQLLTRLQTIATENHIHKPLSQSFALQHTTLDPVHQVSMTDHRINGNLYKEFVQAFQGRALLLEEINQLTEQLSTPLSFEQWKSYVQLAHLREDLQITNGLATKDSRSLQTYWRKQRTYTCKRCGSGAERMVMSLCPLCGKDCPYCEECLTMGRTRFCSLLVQGKANVVSGNSNKPAASLREARKHHEAEPYVAATTGFDRRHGVSQLAPKTLARWEPYLTPWGLSTAQTAASLEGLRFLEGGVVQAVEKHQSVGAGGIRRGQAPLVDSASPKSFHEPRRFLIWAVTGAGKTEMIFPFIQYELSRGGRVLVATPRKDVVLELRPRIAKAFPEYSVVTLYGGSEQRWEQGDITLATTHQLMRFSEAFDLVIIDEIDAFPYHNNPMLEYAAAKVCKPNGNYMLLSATPPKLIRKAAERGKLPHVKVPVRFHRHPLPVPAWLEVNTVKHMLMINALPARLLRQLQASVERGAQVFIFVANIKLVDPLVLLLRNQLQMEVAASVEGTSSKDSNRTDKVQQFRDKEIRLLVTTTILERGVTIPKSDVYILDADSRLFDEAALVQMAGRAGRSKEDPAGKVYFAAKERTNAQKGAIRQIKLMNRIARKQGYLDR
ncbi:primosome assembly protein PriA [compost metagenome]